MPGTVQVSILELKGLPSSKSSSSMSIKVSLGKHTYEAEGEKSDFFFPLTTLRDNLVVKVHDNEGNEIAHTGVKSRLIAEKGSWDDLFPLEGGGLVHMKLKFSLSEDERNRIRNMREIAFRKKQEELLNKNKNLQIVVASSGGGNEMPSTPSISDKARSIDLPLKASTKLVSFKSGNKPINSSASVQVKEDNQGYDLKEQSPLEETPSRLKEDDQPYNLIEQKPSKLKEDDQPYNLMEQSSQEKTPSELRENDQANKLKEQSPLGKTLSRLQEDDQLYEMKEQSPLEKTLSRIQEDDQPYDTKEQSSLDKILSRLQEDDQTYSMKEQSPLEKRLSRLQEDDQRYNMKEQSPLEETPSELKEDDQPYNVKEQIPMEETRSKLDQNPLEKTSCKLQEDDQPCKLKEQSPLEKTPSIILKDDQAFNLKKESALENTPSKANKDDQRYKLKEQSPLEERPSKVKDDGQCYNLKKPSPLEKTTTKVKDNDQRDNLKGKNQSEKTASKVRETIAAFENSRQTQGRVNTAKEQSSRELPTSTGDEREPIETRSTTYETKYVDNVEYKSKEILEEKEPKEKYPLHNIFESEQIKSSKNLRQPSNLQQDKISGGDHDLLSDDNQPSNSVTEQKYASDAPSLTGRRRQCLCNNFHGWIFLEEEICRCIVSDNRMVRDLLDDYSVDPKSYPGKLVDDEVISSKDDKLPGIDKKPELAHSSGDGASRGPHGQVIRIVIMVGFGLLVLFTRNRNSR